MSTGVDVGSHRARTRAGCTSEYKLKAFLRIVDRPTPRFPAELGGLMATGSRVLVVSDAKSASHELWMALATTRSPKDAGTPERASHCRTQRVRWWGSHLLGAYLQPELPAPLGGQKSATKPCLSWSKLQASLRAIQDASALNNSATRKQEGMNQ